MFLSQQNLFELLICHQYLLSPNFVSGSIRHTGDDGSEQEKVCPSQNLILVEGFQVRYPKVRLKTKRNTEMIQL